MTIPRDFKSIQNVFAVIEILRTIDDKAGLVCAVGDLSRDFGFDSFVVTRLPVKEQRVRPHVLLHSGWDDWLYNYDRSRYYLADPVARKCFETVEPFSWAEAAGGKLSPEAVKIMDDAASRGMQRGLAIPIIDHCGFHSVVSLVGGPDDLQDFEKRALQLFGYYVHGAAERIARIQATSATLSERELDILHLLACGKTMGTIGKELQISVETVKTHVKRARVKLQTKNVPQTIVEAMRSRQLLV
ncbi:LuxR family transcriptional regulator [Fulvimarina sp. 2208YS6-2-32]|uniref:LuxR family transcriptional regulator n=1 Tax=Fulvimarina uroteuthidis TaxID=3098149 RepID=A0ABU5I6N5_9HYPH|nr:LuxR family transcriptional regulator [Fulvimarina sp. 2208YS6-2-32]MDY8110742.1 LuxR family transcriptional regulator [Fulvimarina sp. 2208YS6-2-32]